MIVVTEISNLTYWVNENRPDKESNKPYFMADEVEGGYQIQQDALIEKGLKELNQPYSIVIDVNGVSIEVESKYFEM